MNLWMLLLALGVFTFTSCSEDDKPVNNDVVGCMEEGAENYNPNATVAGTCVYARDKFLGQYLGSLTLQTLTLLDQNDVTFEITPGITSDNEVIISASGQSIPINFKGEAEGNLIKVDAEQVIPDLSAINPIVSGEGVVKFVGDVAISDDGQMINGDLDITITGGNLPQAIQDVGTISAIKQ